MVIAVTVVAAAAAAVAVAVAEAVTVAIAEAVAAAAETIAAAVAVAVAEAAELFCKKSQCRLSSAILKRAAASDQSRSHAPNPSCLSSGVWWA